MGLSSQATPIIAHTALLVAFIFGGSYAGPSNLCTAYLEVACVTWWIAEIPHPAAGNDNDKDSPVVGSLGPMVGVKHSSMSGSMIYENYFQQARNTILKPLFFAFIGCFISVSKMFFESVVT